MSELRQSNIRTQAEILLEMLLWSWYRKYMSKAITMRLCLRNHPVSLFKHQNSTTMWRTLDVETDSKLVLYSCTRVLLCFSLISELIVAPCITLIRYQSHFLTLGAKFISLTSRSPVQRILLVSFCVFWASLVAQLVKNPPAMQKTAFLGWKNPLEKG